jgi:hypothetical protein
MDFDVFKQAVDSMVGFQQLVGLIGGDPLLHPDFEKQCEYLQSKIPLNQCGLWSCFPAGYEGYRDIIVKTFGHIFLNSHERNDILHCPVLVASEEVLKGEANMWMAIWNCWLQNTWSASINPNGAFACETAAEMSMLFNINAGWKVERGWWMRTPLHFIEQLQHFCPKCSVCLPLQKRVSTEGIDDISQGNYERLKYTSPKIKAGKYKIHDLKLCQDNRPMATYKDPQYRDKIAKRYGMFLVINEQGYQTPYLLKDWDKSQVPEDFKLNTVELMEV